MKQLNDITENEKHFFILFFCEFDNYSFVYPSDLGGKEKVNTITYPIAFHRITIGRCKIV